MPLEEFDIRAQRPIGRQRPPIEAQQPGPGIERSEDVVRDLQAAATCIDQERPAEPSALREAREHPGIGIGPGAAPTTGERVDAQHRPRADRLAVEVRHAGKGRERLFQLAVCGVALPAEEAARLRGGGAGGQAQRSGPRRGDNLRVRLNITFEEAAFGCEKEINVGRVEQCPDCKGTGCAPGTTPEVCPDCKGTGSVRTTQRTPFGVVQTSGACKKCGGHGKIIHQPCPRCGGRGAVRKNQTIKVKIPAGIDDGQTLNLRGKGNAGLDGGPAGDLLITVFVKPHPLFERDGNSVLMEMPVSFAQAALGAEIEVPTIDGRVKLTIPEGTQPGSVFRLRGKGIPYLQSKGGGRGDQFVTITVTVPKNMTSEQKQRLRAYAEAMNEAVSEGRSGIFGSKKKR